MTEKPTIGEKIVASFKGRAAVAEAIDLAIADAFKTGFEHACAGGKEASRKLPQLRGAMPLVLYFGNERDRQEFADMIYAAKPHMVEIKIPEKI